MKVVTLVFVHDDEKVLLGYKKRGFGSGRWNGFGGKVEEGETLEQAAIRELQEESGLIAKSLEYKGEIEFSFVDDNHLLCHIFTTNEVDGEPMESEEMKPQWFAHHEIPYTEMWSDDVVWLPHVLEGKRFKAHFAFDTEVGNTFTSHKIDFIE
ncbi:MAG TPA: 8-oxo-dGTP diphosphatase [Candidatus Doudnabacteria bacterium]|nr:8-oxo-dGTP diphosphatase [Candidatus Doudnabacteria bacterium]